MIIDRIFYNLNQKNIKICPQNAEKYYKKVMSDYPDIYRLGQVLNGIGLASLVISYSYLNFAFNGQAPIPMGFILPYGQAYLMFIGHTAMIVDLKRYSEYAHVKRALKKLNKIKELETEK